MTLAVFSPALACGFVDVDDDDYVTENPRVRAGLTVEGAVWAFTRFHSANWHPLTWLSHMLDCQVWGLDPLGHHLTGVLVHAASVSLLHLTLAGATGARGRSAFVAALFALHPLRVESVVWVSERKDVLSALFFLLAVRAYLGWAARPGAARYLAVLAFHAAGLTCKATGVTLPFVLLLLDGWPLGRLGRGERTRRALEKLPLVALSAACAAVTLAAQRAGGMVQDLDRLPMDVRAANALIAIWTYIERSLWPVNLSYFYEHGHPSLVSTGALAAGTALVGLTLALVFYARRHPWALAGWLWYLVTLVPMIGLVQVGMHSTADRYSYLPSVGLYVLVAWGGERVLGSRPCGRAALAVAGAILLGATALATRAQIAHWRDEEALQEWHYWASGPSTHARMQRAIRLQRQGDMQGAIAEVRAVIATLGARPPGRELRRLLIPWLVFFGEEAEALQVRDALLAEDPDDVATRLTYANALHAAGRLEEAWVLYHDVLRRDPGNRLARNEATNIAERWRQAGLPVPPR